MGTQACTEPFVFYFISSEPYAGSLYKVNVCALAVTTHLCNQVLQVCKNRYMDQDTQALLPVLSARVNEPYKPNSSQNFL